MYSLIEACQEFRMAGLLAAQCRYADLDRRTLTLRKSKQRHARHVSFSDLSVYMSTGVFLARVFSRSNIYCYGWVGCCVLKVMVDR